jgi:hypothetical protein
MSRIQKTIQVGKEESHVPRALLQVYSEPGFPLDVSARLARGLSEQNII